MVIYRLLYSCEYLVWFWSTCDNYVIVCLPLACVSGFHTVTPSRKFSMVLPGVHLTTSLVLMSFPNYRLSLSCQPCDRPMIVTLIFAVTCFHMSWENDINVYIHLQMFDATFTYLHQHVCWGLAAYVFLLMFGVCKTLFLTLVPVSIFRESVLFQPINVPPVVVTVCPFLLWLCSLLWTFPVHAYVTRRWVIFQRWCRHSCVL